MKHEHTLQYNLICTITRFNREETTGYKNRQLGSLNVETELTTNFSFTCL